MNSPAVPKAPIKKSGKEPAKPGSKAKSWLSTLEDDELDAEFANSNLSQRESTHKESSPSQLVSGGALFSDAERSNDDDFVDNLNFNTNSMGFSDFEIDMPVPGHSVEEINFGTPSMDSNATPKMAPELPPLGDDGTIDAFVESKIARPPVISLSKKSASPLKSGMRTLSAVTPTPLPPPRIKPAPKVVKQSPPKQKPTSTPSPKQSTEVTLKLDEDDSISLNKKDSQPLTPEKDNKDKELKTTRKPPQKEKEKEITKKDKEITKKDKNAKEDAKKEKEDKEKGKVNDATKAKKKWSMSDSENQQKKITDFTKSSDQQIKRRKGESNLKDIFENVADNKKNTDGFPTEIRRGLATPEIRKSQALRWVFDSSLKLSGADLYSLLSLDSYSSIISEAKTKAQNKK